MLSNHSRDGSKIDKAEVPPNMRKGRQFEFDQAHRSVVLTFRGVKKWFGVPGSMRHVPAVNGVSLDVRSGETVGLIGESGSGKSTTGKLAMGLLPPDEGTVEFLGHDLKQASRRELRLLRSKRSIVFQEAGESLNPRMTVSRIVEEPLLIHEPDLGREERQERVHVALKRVTIGTQLWQQYPKRLSGGEQQRVAIARAIVGQPRLIVLDEPTSSLDLSVRGQILDVLLEVQSEMELAYLLISHDLRTVSHMSDRIHVMYLGHILESGEASKVVRSPLHPYTLTLLSSVLSANPKRLTPELLPRGDIDDVPSSNEGCVFRDRCPMLLDERCHVRTPVLEEKAPGHLAATFCQVTPENWKGISNALD